MKKFLLALVLCSFAGFAGESSPTPVSSDTVAPKPLIQMAILLDTSSSMNGLINQARAQLWAVVNTFINATREGKKPELQVALYQYGTPSLGKETGFIRQILPFTTDLDAVSKELFALTTNGGEEYCGWVIKTATEQLAWSQSTKDLKVIFIAGNEPFSQGPVDYRESCKNAIAKGIQVNTIHCGDDARGTAQHWRDGALLADGKYSFIDMNAQVAQVDAPQDKELVKLNEQLNSTYIAYGAKGAEAAANQRAQDGNSAGLGNSSFGGRAAAKASANYRNEHWDVVDAYKQDAKKLAELKDEELPENMRKMSTDERKTYVETKAKDRADVQAKILKLNEERSKYVADELKKRAVKDGDQLDKAMSGAAKEQARKRGFELKE